MLESQSVIQSQRIIRQVNQGMIVQGQGGFVQKRIFLDDAGTEDIFACEERKRAFVAGLRVPKGRSADMARFFVKEKKKKKKEKATLR